VADGGGGGKTRIKAEGKPYLKQGMVEGLLTTHVKLNPERMQRTNPGNCLNELCLQQLMPFLCQLSGKVCRISVEHTLIPT
jgi:hypothetical protein